MKGDTPSAITLRLATPDDKPFVLSLLPRFAEFGLPSWRDARAARDLFERTLAGALDHAPAESTFLIAQDGHVEPLGFLYLQTEVEVFTGEKVGYISDVAVAPEAEGRGVGAALMGAAEAWARSRGYRSLTLTVFATNSRARRLYERLGYEEDSLKMVKTLG